MYSYYQLEMEDDYAGWGDITLFYEVDEEGEVSRQVEVFANGKALYYDQNHSDDEYGALAEPMPDHEYYMAAFRISRGEFERATRLRFVNRKSG